MKKTPSPAAPRSPRAERLIAQLVRQNVAARDIWPSGQECAFSCLLRGK